MDTMKMVARAARQAMATRQGLTTPWRENDWFSVMGGVFAVAQCTRVRVVEEVPVVGAAEEELGFLVAERD